MSIVEPPYATYREQRKNPSRLARRCRLQEPPALSSREIEDTESPEQGASSKYKLRHGHGKGSNLGWTWNRPVRSNSASGHSIDTWCEVGKSIMPSQYPKFTGRKDHCTWQSKDHYKWQKDHRNWQRITIRNIKHWKMMSRSKKGAMLPRVSRKNEHKNTVLNKLLIWQSRKGKNQCIFHVPLQSSRDNIKKETLYIPGCSYRAADIISFLGCPLENKIGVISSSVRKIRPLRAPGVSRRIEHVPPRKRKNQKSSKTEFSRLWPHVISCRLAPGGAHPHPEFESEPGPYNPGIEGENTGTTGWTYSRRANFCWSRDCDASTERGATPRQPMWGEYYKGTAQMHDERIHLVTCGKCKTKGTD